MQSDFWFNCWKNNTIGFHESEANPNLVKHLDLLKLAPGKRILLPLCGKTLDIPWLASKGFQIVGIELSELAIQQLFDEMGVRPEVSTQGQIKRYHAENVDILVGDFFSVDKEALGQVDAVFDRGSLVALPVEMRKQYASHLNTLVARTPQLVVCYQYDQSLMSGPPFSVSEEELRQHYAQHYNLRPLDSTKVSDKFSAAFPITEYVWLLERKN